MTALLWFLLGVFVGANVGFVAFGILFTAGGKKI